MIQAAPFILPIAEALGLSVATLGMAKVTDEVNKYIQENPEQAQKIITTIMPAQGIATMFKKRGIGDNNPPSPIKKEKPPQQEPPKGPNIEEEILTNLEIRELEKKVEEKELENKAFAKFQYMANKEGDQTIGNREILLDLDEELFNKYVKDITKFKNFKEYDKEFPNQTIKLFKRADQKEYQITKVGEVGKDFFPDFGEDPYKIEVKDFNSKKAIKHSKIFDSDVYPIKKAMGGIIDKPLTGRSRYI